MLQLRETRIIRALADNVAPGVTIHEEGVPLVYVKIGGEAFVTPSSGTGTEQFAGVSLSRNAPPAVLPRVETLTMTAATQTLLRAPMSGQVFVKAADNTTRAVVTSGSPVSGEVKVDAAGNVSAHSSDNGVALTFQYMYVPTTLEAQSIIGDLPIGGLPSTAMGSIGVLKQAQISTNFFDASVDWSSVQYVKLGNGVFAAGDATDHIAGVVVKNSPSVDNAFLTLSFNVA